MSFTTVHVLRALPMHNLNRDQNGLPKSQFDGGVQRGRLSSQALKRPARIAFREAVAHIDHAPSSIRTMDSNAVTQVLALAKEFAATLNKTFDEAAAKKTANSVVKSLAKAVKDEPEAGEPTSDAGKPAVDKKDNILLFSTAELETLAQAIVDEQNGGAVADVDAFIQDFKSASLDIAAFGRMFANRADKSTQAAVAVSHAVMTHEMALTIDYFTAVDEFESENARQDSGAGHLGLAYYTSGVYYSTFTIDPAQLRRSWSGFCAATAQEQVEALVKALIEALPTGKLTNTDAHTRPLLVLVENQKGRNVYEFETPVVRASDGGYTVPSIARLAEQYAAARKYDADNYLETYLYAAAPTVDGTFAGARPSASVGELAASVASLVFASVGGGETA